MCEPERRWSYDKIIAHPFFRGIDWKNLRRMKAPWVPELEGPTDTRNFDVSTTRLLNINVSKLFFKQKRMQKFTSPVQSYSRIV